MDKVSKTLVDLSIDFFDNLSDLYRHLTYTLHHLLLSLENTTPISALFDPCVDFFVSLLNTAFHYIGGGGYVLADAIIWLLSLILIYSSFTLLARLCALGGRDPIFYYYEASISTRRLVAWLLAKPIKWLALAYHSGLVFYPPEHAVSTESVWWWLTSSKYHVYNSLARLLAWEVVVLVTVFAAKFVAFYARGGGLNVRPADVPPPPPPEAETKGNAVGFEAFDQGFDLGAEADEGPEVQLERELAMGGEAAGKKTRGRKARSTSTRAFERRGASEAEE
ncbi:hypothetical protein MBLNU230_g2749t1 [Neophaeotheca triangularis]